MACRRGGSRRGFSLLLRSFQAGGQNQCSSEHRGMRTGTKACLLNQVNYIWHKNWAIARAHCVVAAPTVKDDRAVTRESHWRSRTDGGPLPSPWRPLTPTSPPSLLLGSRSSSSFSYSTLNLRARSKLSEVPRLNLQLVSSVDRSVEW